MEFLALSPRIILVPEEKTNSPEMKTPYRPTANGYRLRPTSKIPSRFEKTSKEIATENCPLQTAH